MVKINVGSGPVSAKGWINYDWGLLPVLGKYGLLSIFVKVGLLPKNYEAEWPELELMDIRTEWSISDSSVDYVFCSQVLEHFDPDEGKEIIKQIYRVLKNKGKLRLSVPDFKKVSENYLKDEKIDDLNEVIWGYKKNEYWGIVGKIKSYFIRGHKWFYNKNSLRILLENNGFKNIKFYTRAKGTIPDLKKLEDPRHEKTSLYLEAVKLV